MTRQGTGFYYHGLISIMMIFGAWGGGVVWAFLPELIPFYDTLARRCLVA